MSDQVLLVSGSLRDGSTNTALLRTARLVAPPGVTAVLHEGLARLPHFNPDDDRAPLHPEVAALRAAVRAADAILFCTPEYAGALPGSLKNMLEWIIGDEQPGSIYGKRVAWVNVSSAATGAADAHESLRKVLRYAHADVVDEACAAIPVTRRDVADGTISDPAIRDGIVKVLTSLLALLRLGQNRSQRTIQLYRDGVRPLTERLGPGRCRRDAEFPQLPRPARLGDLAPPHRQGPEPARLQLGTQVIQELPDTDALLDQLDGHAVNAGRVRGHMPLWAVFLTLIGGTALFGHLGTRTFRNRVVN